MLRKDEKKRFITEYVRSFFSNRNVNGYEIYAEREDIADTCENAIEWADKTMIEKCYQLLKKHEELGDVSFKYEFLDTIRKELQP